MTLNLSSVFAGADTILNSLLSKYVGLKFIGYDQQNENSPYYLLNGETVTTGFYYKTKKLPVTGEVVETLKIVPSDDTVGDVLTSKKLKYLELIDTEGNFTRFTMKTLKEPHPPNYEWLFLITPNNQEKTIIT